jgi:hypothetical protein
MLWRTAGNSMSVLSYRIRRARVRSSCVCVYALMYFVECQHECNGSGISWRGAVKRPATHRQQPCRLSNTTQKYLRRRHQRLRDSQRLCPHRARNHNNCHHRRRKSHCSQSRCRRKNHWYHWCRRNHTYLLLLLSRLRCQTTSPSRPSKTSKRCRRPRSPRRTTRRRGSAHDPLCAPCGPASRTRHRPPRHRADRRRCSDSCVWRQSPRTTIMRCETTTTTITMLWFWWRTKRRLENESDTCDCKKNWRVCESTAF